MENLLFKDVVKIVYNWLGPRGPIWNTEVPNLLSLANISEGTQAFSLKYWNDDIWRKLFQNKKEFYCLYPVVDLKDYDIFIMPFILTWRTPLEHYFSIGNGLFEFAHVPGHVSHLIRNHKGFVLIDLSVEAYVNPSQLLAIHNYFNSSAHIPLNKVIYLTGAMNANVLYENFCQQYNIPNNPRMRINVISYPSSQSIYSEAINGRGPEPHTETIYDAETLPQKLFLSWNRRFRPHRLYLLTALDKAGLIDKSYISLGLVDPENIVVKYKEQITLHYMPQLELTEQDVQNFNSKLPLILDGETDNMLMCEERGTKVRHFYQNSLVSIVTETNFDANAVTLTEKSFKPIKEKHPFISVGVKGTLQAIKDLGYKTFSDFWDESYDTIDDPNLRMLAIINLCKEISTWDDNKKLEFKRNVKPILEHNYELLKIPAAQVASTKITQLIRNTIS